MPTLTNPKHERFCQELAKGTSAARAYVLVGYNEHRQNASGLARKEPIQARVAEILAESREQNRAATQKAAEALSIDRQWVMARLVDNATKAAEKEDFAPSNRALELIGKELEMFVDRSENLNVDATVRREPLPAEDWLAKHSTH